MNHSRCRGRGVGAACVMLLLVWTCLAPVPGRASEAAGQPTLGAEIYEVQPQRPGSAAGLVAGDVVDAYVAESGDSGAIVSALDLLGIDMRWSDLGEVKLSGSSQGQARAWALKGSGWGIKLRPVSAGAERKALIAALAALETGETADGCAQLLQLADGWHQQGRRGDSRWAQFRCLDERIRKKQLDAAQPILARWYPVADEKEAVVLGLLAVKLAGAAYDISDWVLLDQLLGHARAALDDADPRLATLADLRQGKATNLRGQFAQVLPVLEPAAQLLRRQAGGSLRLAAVQNELAWANLNLGHPAEAERLLRDTLEIARARSLNDVDLSKYQGHLAMVLHARNDLEGAEREVEQALQRLIAMQAGDKFTAPVWNNLGVIRRDRGDYVGAEDAFRQTLAMEERRDPSWVSVAIAYGNMAAVARARGDLEAAQRWAQRARPILDKAVPEGTEVAQNWHLQGLIAFDRGRLDEAQARFERAISVWLKISPRAPRHAQTVEQLGLVEQGRGAFDTARAHYETALAMRIEALPDGSDVGQSWLRIGSLELDLGHLDAALSALEKAVAISERLSPQAISHASALNALGRTQQALGQQQRARDTLCKAAEVLDRSRTRLSRDPREQAEAMAQFARIRTDCVSAQVQVGNPVAAFDTLERGRGRALLALLSRRDLVYADAVPGALRREWAALEADISRLQNQRGTGAKPAATESPTASIEERLRELEATRSQLIDRIRAEAPRFAALQFPEPAGFADVRQSLADDAALVAVMVGRTQAYAFVVRKGLTVPIVRSLAVVPAGLTTEVARMRAALSSATADPQQVRREAGRWHQRLIAPIAADLVGVRRLLLVPDAELFALPFAALQDAEGKFLIEHFSVSVADSATLAIGVGQSRARSAPNGLVAVANGDGGTVAVPGALRGAASALPPLPFARIEVERIGALSGDQATIITDASATEARVRALAASAGRVHFAVHGVFDPLAPLESGLLLRPDAHAAGAAADGLLQVWEIFDAWRTPADLVTLSGCDTGQGSALAEEGLLGLTRAFHFAGARHVVASLWSISDRSTALLMTRFYEQLASGLPVDLALQAAQLSLLHQTMSEAGSGAAAAQRGVGGLSAAPRDGRAERDWTWAAFQVFGG